MRRLIVSLIGARASRACIYVKWPDFAGIVVISQIASNRTGIYTNSDSAHRVKPLESPTTFLEATTGSRIGDKGFVDPHHASKDRG